MANWAWFVIVATALNLTRWSQVLGGLDTDGDMRAKRLRYRYLNIPALLVHSGRRLMLQLQRNYPLFDATHSGNQRSLANSDFFPDLPRDLGS